MELIERAGFLASLQTKFENVVKSEGHCVLIGGEAGIGKTSLVKSFCNDKKNDSKIYQGSCDALFTPRPLAPLYDIVWQMEGEAWGSNANITDRSELFASFLHKLETQKQTTIIVFEDIHWADEATLDFIKFFARRITHLHCLLILTFRDNEIHSRHPLRNVLGQLPTDSFTRLQLTPLSRQAVEKMAFERGYKGEDVYSISGGNPFYVNEILASYSLGIPDNIRDSILSVYNTLDEKTKQVCQIISVFPTGLEMEYLEKMEPLYPAAIHNCLDLKILIPKNGQIFFKHELYRRTIETSLSPLLRSALNKRILALFLESFEQKQQIERIVHYAKNANESELVVKYAPLAAMRAASVGAHIEASKLYLSAIEYYQGNERDTLIRFYQSYAYECYLTNQVKEAIIYTTRSLNLLKEKNDIENTGNCLRFLSRLWWFDGNRKKAEMYANDAIEVLNNQPSSKAKAMVYSNMSQLKMLSDQHKDCITWGENAIEIAKEVGDEETLSHALNNVGTVQMDRLSSRERGIKLLKQSLDIALKNSYDDHAARAYTNLSTSAVKMKDYTAAKENLEKALQYCEERDLDSYTTYLLAYKARLNLETGNWIEAYRLAENLIKNEDQQPIVKISALVTIATMKMRRGDPDVLPLLTEAKEKAFETMEAQRIIPVIISLLEYEWITGKKFIENNDFDFAIKLVEHTGNIYEKSEFKFWLLKARKQHWAPGNVYKGYDVSSVKNAQKAAALWEKTGNPYAQALTLFEGDANDKRKVIKIVQELGADAVYEKMKLEMRTSGIKSIPRGIRRTTRSNPAHITMRELDILQLLKKGLQNKEIAESLFISPKTVDHHLSSIFSKLDVNSRTKAIQRAIHLDIIK